MNDICSSSPLCTDLYELTMAACYLDQGMDDTATFSLFLRHKPRRGFYVAAGLEPAIDWLGRLVFKPDDIAYLRSTGLFKAQFLTYLEGLRFSGSVRALPEGALFFPQEPVLEVTAPLIQAQLVETFLINTIGVHSLIATKAARCVHAARGRGLIDFSLRRAQGGHAGMAVARSAYMVGFDATSNVQAGRQFGIPIAGTMAHSFVQCFEDEQAAFRAYAQTFPQRSIFLIDTYDPIEGAHRAAAVAQTMAAEGRQLVGIRLDSGDMIAQSREVRRMLDAAGLSDVKIFASGGYDEYGIADAVDQGAAIDAFGVGTKMGVSADLPYLDLAYKLVRYAGRNVRKYSPGKQSLGGAKQVFRRVDGSGHYTEDIIGAAGEAVSHARALLTPVMEKGKKVGPWPSLSEIRSSFQEQWQALPVEFKDLFYPSRYPVTVSGELIALQKQIGKKSP